MSKYKFIEVEGGDRKQSTLTKSVRSHAIRAGLEKTTTYHPPSKRAKAAVQGRRSSKPTDGLVVHSDKHGGMKGMLRDKPGRSGVSVKLATTRFPGDKTTKTEFMSTISAEVRLCLEAIRIEKYLG